MSKKRRNLVNDKKYHYTYRITNIKEKMYYYGVHSCDCLPKEDIGVKYWSTSKRDGFIDHQKQNPEQYKYKVIKIFGTRIEAVEHEIFLHKKFDVKLHKKFYNDANQTSTNFDTTGKVAYKDTRDNTTGLISCEIFRNNIYYVGISTGVPKSEETKCRMSESAKGVNKSQEHILARIKTVTAIQENGKSIMQKLQ